MGRLAPPRRQRRSVSVLHAADLVSTGASAAAQRRLRPRHGRPCTAPRLARRRAGEAGLVLGVPRAGHAPLWNGWGGGGGHLLHRQRALGGTHLRTASPPRASL